MQLLKNKKGRIASALTKTALVLYAVFVAFVGAAGAFVPDEITVTRSSLEENAFVSADAEGVSAEAKLFGRLPIKNVKINVVEENTLIPCGDVFGVKFFTKGVLVVKLSDIETKDGAVSPAKKAGIKVGDIIERIDGKEINTVEEMAELVENCRGKDLVVNYKRQDEECLGILSPTLSLSDKKYKTGIWVRDSTAGIGTMTYYNPKTGEFAGLGHGICDVDTGLLMPLLEANVVDVQITDIIKGRKGAPGELKGDFDRIKKGEVTENTHRGIYGVAESDVTNNRKALPLGFKNEIKEGNAKIICELDENGTKEYQIKITKINDDDSKDKNFVIEVTDDALLQKTGGIVQGMSGSPVIQNGKLVGAVTHVLVNNPKKGYGIFIENMLLSD